MKVKIGKKLKDIESIWWEPKEGILKAIDQRKLPFSFEIFEARTVDDVCIAIKEMVVRGAPLIGITAAYGVVIAASNFQGGSIEEFSLNISAAISKLEKTRPTAVDLFNVLEIMRETIEPNMSAEKNIKLLLEKADKLRLESIRECLAIGEVGNELITSKIKNIMTICNAGALATVDYGTALAPMRIAHKNKKEILVYVNETRPRMQGARLTAWELYNEGIEHKIIVDSAAGYFISQGEIDMVIVGADRIIANGYVANKIGTFPLSVLCKEYNIPFYVAVPLSTFDLKTKISRDIVIEERDGREVSSASSIDHMDDTEPKHRTIHHPHSPNLNPAFDITPAENITGIITPYGVLRKPYQKSIEELLKNHPI